LPAPRPYPSPRQAVPPPERRSGSGQDSAKPGRPPFPPRPRLLSECTSFAWRCRFLGRSRGIPAHGRLQNFLPTVEATFPRILAQRRHRRSASTQAVKCFGPESDPRSTAAWLKTAADSRRLSRPVRFTWRQAHSRVTQSAILLRRFAIGIALHDSKPTDEGLRLQTSGERTESIDSDISSTVIEVKHFRP
jgi:hypothetical protein